jgi:hypothetical protein
MRRSMIFSRPAKAPPQMKSGVDVQEFLVRVLATPLGRDAGLRALEDLQQGLLHSLPGHVPGDRGVVGLAGDLVHLVDVDDAGLGLLDVEVGGLDELQKDVLDILAHVAGLGESGSVGDGEGHVEYAGQRLGQKGLATAGGPQQKDVGLLELDVLIFVRAHVHALVVVVDRHRERPFGLLLPDDVLGEDAVDLLGLGQIV